MAINRFEVYLVNLDPTVGSEIKKTRPCLVVSPDEMNHNIRTMIVAPLTTKGQRYRVTFAMAGSPGGKIPVKRLAVRAAGKKDEFAFDSTDRKPDNMGWIEYAWEFEAVAEKTTIEFHTAMDSDPYFGPAIDNVRVRLIAERK